MPIMAKERTVNYTVTHEDLIDFAQEIMRQTQEMEEQKRLEEKSLADGEEYLTRKQARELLKRCEATMSLWARKGYLVPVRIGGKYLYRKSDVMKLIR